MTSIAQLIEQAGGQRPAKAKPKPKGKKPRRGGRQLSTPAGLLADELRLSKFCHALVFKHDFNGTRAYLEMAPHVTEKSAGVEVTRLLAHPRVQLALKAVVDQAKERHGLDTAIVIERWNEIARANIYDYFDSTVDAQNGVLMHVKDPKTLSLGMKRNIRKVKMRTDVSTMGEGENQIRTVSQHVELELHDVKGVLDSMARAGEMFGPLGLQDGSAGVASAIEEGFKRVLDHQQQQKGRTIDVKAADVTDA